MACLPGHIQANAQPTRMDSSPDQKRFSNGEGHPSGASPCKIIEAEVEGLSEITEVERKRSEELR